MLEPKDPTDCFRFQLQVDTSLVHHQYCKGLVLYIERMPSLYEIQLLMYKPYGVTE